jgi:hypothetical protein
MNGRIPGGCCVGERAMAPILESYGYQGAIKMFGRVSPRDVECRRTRVKNFQPRTIGMDLNPASAMPRQRLTTLDNCVDVNRVAALRSLSSPAASFLLPKPSLKRDASKQDKPGVAIRAKKL